MTPNELRALRQRLGLSQAQLAAKLGLKSGRRTIGRWECGETPVPRASALAIQALAERAQFERAMDRLPEWLICEPPTGGDGDVWVLHARAPRFLVYAEVDGGETWRSYEPGETRDITTPSGFLLSNWLWFDPAPTGGDLDDLALRIDEQLALDEAHAEDALEEIQQAE